MSAGDALDLRGLRCPLPVLRTRKALAAAAHGAVLSVLSDDPLAAVDIPHFVRERGDQLVTEERLDGFWRFTIRKGGAGG